MDPTFAITYKEIRDKLTGKIHISKRSSLILKGSDTQVKDYTLDGHAVAENGTLLTG